MKLACHDCQSENLHDFPEYSSLKRVTSDCKSWQSGGKLALCLDCGLLQAPITDFWKSECEQIYGDYSVYYQSGGIEQAVFDKDTGAPQKRSDRLCSEMVKRSNLNPDSGSLLDMGCGNGGFLRAFSKVFPKWELAGSELSDRYESDVRAIPGVTDFFSDGISTVEKKFTGVSMIHFLEHVGGPTGILKAAFEKVEDDGFVFAQVPCPELNPFELLIADHCSHFLPWNMQAICEGLNLSPHEDFQWIPKELSLFVNREKTGFNNTASLQSHLESTIRLVDASLKWLVQIVENAKAASSHKKIGIFGTSIASNWLTGTIGLENIAFFVDEDPTRVGGKHLGLDILKPGDVPAGSSVFFPLPREIFGNIVERRTFESSVNLIS